MPKLVCLGELLIDFQSKGTGSLKETAEFVKKAGGAPANVCVQATKLGIKSVYLTQVGTDGFGDFLIDTLRAEGVDTSHIKQTPDYDTSLAFVSFKKDGEREFSFYRRIAADLYFSEHDFSDVGFSRGDVFEFGSVALATRESRQAHDALISKAKQNDAVVCFDPNLRLSLWKDHSQLRSVVLEYAKKADVIKLGDEELAFVTGIEDSDAAVKVLLENAKVVCVTRGAKGAKLYTSDGKTWDNPGYRVKTVDTTGAGDSFFGGLIAQLLIQNASERGLLLADYAPILDFACKCGAYTTTGYGAIAAMGIKEQVEKIGG